MKGSSKYLNIIIKWLLATQPFPQQSKTFLYKAPRYGSFAR